MVRGRCEQIACSFCFVLGSGMRGEAQEHPLSRKEFRQLTPESRDLTPTYIEGIMSISVERKPRSKTIARQRKQPEGRVCRLQARGETWEGVVCELTNQDFKMVAAKPLTVGRIVELHLSSEDLVVPLVAFAQIRSSMQMPEGPWLLEARFVSRVTRQDIDWLLDDDRP